MKSGALGKKITSVEVCSTAYLKIDGRSVHFWTTMPCSSVYLIAVAYDKRMNMLGVAADVTV